MAFATSGDVAARLGRDLTPGEGTTVTYLLDAATAVIAEALETASGDVDPVPAVVRFVTVELVCRALANPSSVDGLTEQLGQYQYSARFRNEGGGLLLTDRETALVRGAWYGDDNGSTRVESFVDDLFDIYYS